MARKRRSAGPAGSAAQVGGNGNGKDDRPAIAIEFPHGLGDLVQLSIVLRHLAHAAPGHAIDAICEMGKDLSSTPFERRRLAFGSPDYDRSKYAQVISLSWGDCTNDVDGLPSTKPFRALEEVFRIAPRQEWWQYACVVPELARVRAAHYLEEVSGVKNSAGGRYPVALVHYHGYSSCMNKDIPREVVIELVKGLQARKLAVVLLDIDGPPKLAAELGVACPVRGHPVWQRPGQADPQTMLAMIDAATVMVGIDSGPLHLAGCSSTQALGVWTHHHPIRFYDFAPNVVHLVPAGHRRLANGPRSCHTFETRYRHSVYSNMLNAILENVDALDLKYDPAQPSNSAELRGLTALDYGEQYYREHVAAGLDYLGHGEWQISYGNWLANALRWRGHRVLDIGCACGSILRGMGQAGMIVQGVDVSEFMLQLGREKWPDMAPLLHHADASDLRVFDDASWDDLHSAQVAEHWRPEMVPIILRELARVTRDGGLFFCCLDTVELFERQGRTGDGGDPTHLCVKPMTWWQEQLENAGWECVTEEYRPALRAGCDSFLRRYDWDFFVARRRPRGG